MKKYTLLILLVLSACCISAQTLTSIQIGTTLNGPIFLVDGVAYTSPQVFTWPAGSEHVVQFELSTDVSDAPLPYQNNNGGTARYIFGGWVDNEGLLEVPTLTTLTITADPSLTSLIATVTVQYDVHFQFSNETSTPATCPGAPGAPAPAGLVYGIVYIDGICVADTTDLFLPAGPHILNAFPYAGWVFYGWNINSFEITSALASYNVTGPTNITPQFSIAKVVQFMTNPPGLSVLVDRTPIQTSVGSSQASTNGCSPDYTRLPPGAPSGFPPLCVGQFDFFPGSKHQIGAPTPQQDQGGNYWVFSAFDNGQGQNSVYTAGTNTDTIDTVTADFTAGVLVSVLTNPGGFQILVDGQSGATPDNVVWAQGSTHQISAPAQQTDSHGRVWVFSGWSNGGSASQSITVPNTSGFSISAGYVELEQLQVTSAPPGLLFTVDGSTCVTPCSVNKAAGSQSTIIIPASIPSGQTARFDFQSWTDGSTLLSRTVTYSQDSSTLQANYQTSYLLSTASSPAAAATFKNSPGSPDGFYVSGTPVTVTAVPNNGYKFLSWAGDLSGSYATGTLTMSTPHSVTADLASVPFIPPAGIQSAAGPTPDGSVASGSLIAIYGQNLAPSFQIGPSNPLAQTIDNVTVTVNGQLLPLLFVSPGQVAAQVPWEIPAGNYTLLVHSVGQADISGPITVSRDAPAVFTQPNPQNLPLALVAHQDGTVVTPASPALHNEQITIYGTGFGPYAGTIPDGFPPPAGNTFLAVDPITVTCGSAQVQPDWAGAADGMVGMTIVKVTITDAFPSSTTANLTVTVNGKISTPVSLPLQ